MSAIFSLLSLAWHLVHTAFSNWCCVFSLQYFFLVTTSIFYDLCFIIWYYLSNNYDALVIQLHILGKLQFSIMISGTRNCCAKKILRNSRKESATFSVKSHAHQISRKSWNLPLTGKPKPFYPVIFGD